MARTIGSFLAFPGGTHLSLMTRVMDAAALDAAVRRGDFKEAARISDAAKATVITRTLTRETGDVTALADFARKHGAGECHVRSVGEGLFAVCEGPAQPELPATAEKPAKAK